MALVKKKGALAKRTPLQKALDLADGYIAGEIGGVLKDMRAILKDPEVDPRARVAAGSKLMDWAKPKKQPTVAVQVNNNPASGIVSRLGLPSAPPTFAESQSLNTKALTPKEVPKILPEPPRTIGESLRPFSGKELVPTELPIPQEIELAPQSSRAPDRPPSIKQIKPY